MYSILCSVCGMNKIRNVRREKLLIFGKDCCTVETEVQSLLRLRLQNKKLCFWLRYHLAFCKNQSLFPVEMKTNVFWNSFCQSCLELSQLLSYFQGSTLRVKTETFLIQKATNPENWFAVFNHDYVLCSWCSCWIFVTGKTKPNMFPVCSALPMQCVTSFCFAQHVALLWTGYQTKRIFFLSISKTSTG